MAQGPGVQGCWVILGSDLVHTGFRVSVFFPATVALEPRRLFLFFNWFHQTDHCVGRAHFIRCLVSHFFRTPHGSSSWVRSRCHGYTNTHKSHIFSMKHSAHSLLNIHNMGIHFQVSENRRRNLLSISTVPPREITKTPILFERISPMVPLTPLNSIGKFISLKNS